MSSAWLAEFPETDTFEDSTTIFTDSSSPWIMSPCRQGLDCCLAGVALLCFLPVLLLAAVAVRLSSPGPVLFRQRRAGRNRQTFTLYKFRSMRVGSSEGSPITVYGDGRVTAVGRFLRRFKLDELPQLWNVLRGDMALVGPRPKLPQHEGLTLRWRPGLTGAATLAFRDEEEILAKVPSHQLESVYEAFIKPAKARLDADYMSSATFASDIGILRRTIASCLTPWQGAHTFSGEFLERPLSCPYLCFSVWSASASSSWRAPRSRRDERKRHLVWFTVFGLLFAIPRAVVAQTEAQNLPQDPAYSRLDFFGGYSYWATHGSVTGVPFLGSNRGIELSGAYFFNRFRGQLGAELDGKYFFSQSNDSLVSVSAGPIMRFPSEFGFSPFVHVLVGAADIEGPLVPYYGEEFAMWGPQLSLGSGVDYTFPGFDHQISWRVLQADYLFDHVNYGPDQTASLNSVTLTTGLVLHFGHVPPAISLTCSATPRTVFAGEPLSLTAVATHLIAGKHTTYSWEGQGVRFSVQGPVTCVSTKTLPPGQYLVRGFVRQGNGLRESAACSARFTIRTSADVPPGNAFPKH